jgi:hypothetical protein
MAAHRRSRKLIGLGSALGLLMVGAAAGGYAVAGNQAPAETVNLAGVQTGATGQNATVFACLASGKLTHVSMGTPSCPAGSVPVQWSVRTGTAASANPQPGSSPSSSSPSTKPTNAPSNQPTNAPSNQPTNQPSTTPPSTSQASSTPAPASTCTTSAEMGSCGPYTYAQITGTTDEGPTVGQDVWNPISGWQQTLHATSPGNWYVTANMPAGNTAVVSMPGSTANFGQVTNAPTPLSHYSSIYSSFTETMNPTSGTSAEAAYDIWLGQGSSSDWSNEVMIQHDIVNRGTCPPSASATFGGSGGVPVQKWNLCKYGSELIWQLAGTNEQSGSVDILSMLKWLENNGDLPQGSGLWQIDYGFELCSTGGQNETFQVSSYSLNPS